MAVTGSVENYILDLDKFSKLMEINLQTVIKRTALSLFTNIVRRTPVDTGIARASWVIGVNAYASPANLAEGGKLSESEATAKSMDRAKALNVSSPYSLVIISNYMPYIGMLEKGSSTQAPNGMVRLSIEEEFQRMKAALK